MLLRAHLLIKRRSAVMPSPLTTTTTRPIATKCEGGRVEAFGLGHSLGA